MGELGIRFGKGLHPGRGGASVHRVGRPAIREAMQALSAIGLVAIATILGMPALDPILRWGR